MTEGQELMERLAKAIDILREFRSDCERAAGGEDVADKETTVLFLSDEWYDLMPTYQRACWFLNSCEENGYGNI